MFALMNSSSPLCRCFFACSCLYVVLNSKVTSRKDTDRSVPVNQVDNHFNDLHFETWEIFFKSKRLFCLTYVNRTGTSDF